MPESALLLMSSLLSFWDAVPVLIFFKRNSHCRKFKSQKVKVLGQ